MEFSLEMRAVIAPDVLIQETLGELVLLNIQNGQYFGLNSVGTQMWAALTTASSLRAACDTLRDEYEVDDQRLEEDVRKLVKELTESGLLEVRGG
jgi:hypothetical protein